ncbi:MAG: PEPxxWA-CTERM sorting domain-containing protein [Sandaracinobacteroides sp.]
MRFIFAATAAFALAGAANAAVLFSDDFSGETPRLAETAALANWTVTGNVDIVGTPNGFGITCTDNCVDLDGTIGPGELLSYAFGFSAGQRITVSFDLSGNQRDPNSDLFSFEILLDSVNNWQNPTTGSGFTPPGTGANFSDSTSGVYSEIIAGNLGFVTYDLAFTPQFAGTMQLRFATGSADFYGPLLDNVLVTQAVIPEPATWAMLIAGFGLVGVAARRRRALAAA